MAVFRKHIIDMGLINNVTQLADKALTNLAKRGQNGALSAGAGSFNALSQEIHLKTGMSFTLIQEIVLPIWNDFWEMRRMQGLDMWPDRWHTWEF